MIGSQEFIETKTGLFFERRHGVVHLFSIVFFARTLQMDECPCIEKIAETL
jgi:hypothetical protein